MTAFPRLSKEAEAYSPRQINERWLARVEAEMADRMEARARIGRIQLRTERRAKVNRFMARDGYWPLMSWLVEPVPAASEPWTLVEVLARLDKAYRFELARKRNNYWGYDPAVFAACRKRLIVARYFNLFGSQIWPVEVAA